MVEKYYSRLNTIRFDLDCDIESKNETYNGRSEKWKESEKGVEYIANLKELEKLNESLGDILDNR